MPDINAAERKLKLSAIFADGMVLQRGKPVTVFGVCAIPMSEVTASLRGISAAATTGADGRFIIELPPINEYMTGLSLEVSLVGEPEESITVSDVAVGEVWVVSGQSNAQLEVGYLEDRDELSALADTYPMIRAFRATPAYSLAPDPIGAGRWFAVTASEALRTDSAALSAVGYATAVALSASLGKDVPIAIIHVARGASKIKAWLDYEGIKRLSPSETKIYEDCLASGVLPEKPHTKIATILYNKQIFPLTGYNVSGVIWYQGCGDVSGVSLGSEGRSYTEYFKELTALYRRTFSDERLPFFVHGLAPYLQGDLESAYRLSAFKAEQLSMCEGDEHAYLVPNMTGGGVISDTLFSQGFLHPGRKSPLGISTARLILSIHYGRSDCAIPYPVSAYCSGGEVTVCFKEALALLWGEDAEGVELYYPSLGEWVPALSYISGDKLIAKADAVHSPAAVRYAFGKPELELKDGRRVKLSNENTQRDKENKLLYITDGDATMSFSDYTDTVSFTECGNLALVGGVPVPVFVLELVL
ncbi:MAG: hypothetical protein IKC32_02540 [Clostridia bacterium]|nr:hypothetical protein [Clostridia bacterium]